MRTQIAFPFVIPSLSNLLPEFNGTVEKKASREDGQFTISADTTSPLFKGLDANQKVLLTHGDSIDKVADGFRVIAKSGDLVSAIANEKQVGFEFHTLPSVGCLVFSLRPHRVKHTPMGDEVKYVRVSI